MKKYFPVLAIILFLLSCQSSREPSIPAPIPVTGQAAVSYKIVDEELELRLENHIKAPIRFYVSENNRGMKAHLRELQPLTLDPHQDTLITIQVKDFPHLEPVFKVDYGDLNKVVTHSPVALPVRRSKPIKILQGYNGSYSHNEDRSRYAIDFALKVRDTVYSASNGYVVQVVDGYRYGGKDRRWVDLANKIVVYEPDSGRFFQYSHLVHRGSFVEQGDQVIQGQPIGLSGNTGFSDTPHLHFNVMVPDTSAAGLISVPVDFIEGFKGESLKKNVILQPQ